ncbi:MAG: hypothetical protein M1833_002711 [Piccolia ochrophora]|nr:MAG: hypothetical protein M1833_002711 [Piccolia ochrophora]
MLTSAPHLRIRRPSPTTVEFTVSTRPAHSTLPKRLFFAVTLLLRFVAGTAVLVANYARWAVPGHNGQPLLLNEALQSDAGIAVQRYSKSLDWWVLLAGTAVVGYIVFRRGYTEESLLAISGLGIQTSTSSSTYLSTTTARFIPTNLIQDIFIHEAFKGFEVRFYLAVVVEGEEEVVVVFPKLLPKRKILEQVWRGARACLYESKPQPSAGIASK